MLTIRGGYRWTAAQGGDIPDGAVSAGGDVYVARAAVGGGLHPGEALPGVGCVVEYGGGGCTLGSYEVLVLAKGGRAEWVACAAGSLPEVTADEANAAGPPPLFSKRRPAFAGGYMDVSTSAGEPTVVLVRVGSSFISVAQAQLNAQHELGTRGFDAIAAEGKAEWDSTRALGSIEIGQAATTNAALAAARQRTFYSCLYRIDRYDMLSRVHLCVYLCLCYAYAVHICQSMPTCRPCRSLLFPRMFHEFDADGNTVHWSPFSHQVERGVLYTDNGFWDTHRTCYPLLSLILPSRVAEMVAGFVNAAREGGWFPKWCSPGHRPCMIGTHVDNVVADAVVKGLDRLPSDGTTAFDVAEAYTYLRKDAFEHRGDPAGSFGRLGLADYDLLGFVPTDKVEHAAARTLDFAYNDWGVLQVARQLGADSPVVLGGASELASLARRAQQFRNTFDPSLRMARGRNADGSWGPHREFAWGGAHIEGGVWQCTWGAPHDPAGLAEVMGGAEALEAALDKMMATPPTFEVGSYGYMMHEMAEMDALELGQYNHGNQPQHHCLYLYTTAAGAADKTQRWVRHVCEKHYTADADGLPGDEDNGESAPQPRLTHQLRPCPWRTSLEPEREPANPNPNPNPSPNPLALPLRPPARPPHAPPSHPASTGALQCVRGTSSPPSASTKCALATQSTPSVRRVSVAPRSILMASPARTSRLRRTRATTSMCASRPRA